MIDDWNAISEILSENSRNRKLQLSQYFEYEY
jgi:hypothetical protein